MELVDTEEQRELRVALRRFFADKSPSTEVRRLMETPAGYDPAVWRQMADQLGLQGLTVPEQHGGSGFGFRELAIVLEEMGRVLYCGPYLASAVLAAGALTLSGDEAAMADLLPGIADGSVIATLAPDGDAVRAARSGDGGWTLTGTTTYVLDGATADLLLVAAEGSLFALPGDAPGLTRTPLPTLDQTRRLARLEFAAAPARLVGAAGAAPLAAIGDRAVIALAAEQLGGAQRVLELSVEYAKVRHQFGRPIGSFQAIKHRCADLLVEVESSRSTVLHAAEVVDRSPEQVPVAAALAGAYCSEAYFHAAGETIQIHGGIGFTWEHDAHLYFKRAQASQQLLGDPAGHRGALAGLLEF